MTGRKVGPPSALKRLAEKREKLRLAEERVAELDAERREGAQRVERAKALLLDYHEGVGRGEAEDPAREEQLKADLLAAQGGGVSMRPVQIPHGGGLTDIVLEPVDEVATARWEGARAAVRDAKGELADFIAREMGAIEAELAPEAAEIAREATEVLQRGRAVAVRWERFVAGQADLCVRSDQEALLGTMPVNPCAWVMDAPQQAEMPLPEPFIR